MSRRSASSSDSSCSNILSTKKKKFSHVFPHALNIGLSYLTYRTPSILQPCLCAAFIQTGGGIVTR